MIKDAFEQGAILAVLQRDSNAFENAVQMLKTLYKDYGVPSERAEDIIGLYLTYFLSFNQITAFHCELEQVPFESRSHPSIKYPLELEQFLSEGNYQEIMNLSSKAPNQTFIWFTERIVDTIRNEIA
jgi:hypothetical protein